MNGARVCFWCDGSARPRAPLLWDRVRESYYHRGCARPGAKLVELDAERGSIDGASTDAAVGELETDHDT